MILVVFVIGYTAIACEHLIKIDKAASALFTAVAVWTILILGSQVILGGETQESKLFVEESLMHHVGDISGIVFFLLGAMVIVELVDIHGGFDIITNKITTLNKTKLLWILCFVTFFMSAALDNLTTSIIMTALLRKLVSNKKDLWLFAGMIIIAANAGGAWSPIGDVTTIMLWIGGQVTATNIVLKLIVPSLMAILVPLVIISFKVKGDLELVEKEEAHDYIPEREKTIVMYLGIGALLFVPVFKTLTHLPPFMGILLGLSVLWIATELLHRRKELKIKKKYSILGVLQKIDTPSILFFLGILLAVSALQVAGHLNQFAAFLDDQVGNIWVINSLIGMFSSVVDNVPLVAGAIGMYDLTVYPQDHTFWELLAFCAGTGGSILIIGSAAGVAIMGILKIDFLWYLRNITIYAIIGYASGILTFLLLDTLLK